MEEAKKSIAVDIIDLTDDGDGSGDEDGGGDGDGDAAAGPDESSDSVVADVVPADDPEVVAFRQRAPTDGPIRVVGFPGDGDDEDQEDAVDPVLRDMVSGRRPASGFEWS